MASLEEVIHGSLAAYLSAGRSPLNARIALLRQGHPGLTDEVLTGHFRGFLSPLAADIEGAFPREAGKILEALVPISLDLLAKHFIGPETRSPLLEELWRSVLPKAGTLDEDPLGTAALLTNGGVALSDFSQDAVRRWAALMEAAAPLCKSMTHLRDAGLAAAWRAGVAHAREPACDALSRLPPEAARSALGLGPGPALDGRVWTTDRWWWEGAPRRLRCVREVGDFMGFGGPFRVPPRAGAGSGGEILISDGDRVWHLHADVFGATLVVFPEGGPVCPKDGSFSVDQRGRIVHPAAPEPLQWDFPFNTQASDGEVLAVTSPFSHRVFLFAYAPEGPK